MTEIIPFEDEFDANQDIARSRFADMLHDTERNRKYYLGLEAAINRMHERGLKANVLDIGTGTGLLSMMAVKLGADSVVACDGFLPVVECAAKIIESNGMKNRIKLVKKHSTQIVVGIDMDQRANILVTEVFDTELIGEGAITTFNHAHEHLLEKDAIVVPALGTMYVQIVESPLVNAWNKIKSIADLDGDILLKPPKEVQVCPGEATLHDLQLSQLPANSFRVLTEPIPVFDFDFTSVLEKQRKSVKSVKCIDTGLVQGLFMWWDLKMDVDHKVTLSCAPFWAHPDFDTLKLTSPEILPQNSIPWRDHWIQAIYYLPQTNTLLAENREIQVISCHDEFSLWFEIGQTQAAVLDKKPSCTCGIHLACSRSRIMQINDSPRNKRLISHLEDWDLKNTTLLFMGNCSLMGLAVSKLQPTPSKVIVLEPNRILRHAMEEFIDFNKLWNVNVRENCNKIKLSSVTHLLYEPSCVDVLPWDDFKYFTFIHKNRQNFNDTKLSPCKAKVMGVPVKFLNLHKIRTPLVSCEGFDMTKYDEMILGAVDFADPEVEVHPLWEYPCDCVGEVETLLEIDVGELRTEHEGVGKFTHDGNCNGIAIWIDWFLSSNPKSVISTGPTCAPETGKLVQWSMHDRQGVFFVNPSQTEVSYKVKFLLESNQMQFQFK